MDDVPSRFGSISFQSKLVSGAQNSLFLLLFSRLCSFTPSSEILQMRRKSPVVASKSSRVPSLSGMNIILVAGYGCANEYFGSDRNTTGSASSSSCSGGRTRRPLGRALSPGPGSSRRRPRLRRAAAGASGGAHRDNLHPVIELL